MIRVLVVDDDFRVAELHASYVARTEGFEVVGVAHTAREALRLAETEQPDLVLLDEYLPDASGTSLIGRMPGAVIVVSATQDAA
ncbi:MAG: two-component system response regulator, partial [Nocardioidaceae bacterium]|nr:two-component system response regulator [Nocardioidaceae bacterium]